MRKPPQTPDSYDSLLYELHQGSLSSNQSKNLNNRLTCCLCWQKQKFVYVCGGREGVFSRTLYNVELLLCSRLNRLYVVITILFFAKRLGTFSRWLPWYISTDSKPRLHLFRISPSHCDNNDAGHTTRVPPLWSENHNKNHYFIKKLSALCKLYIVEKIQNCEARWKSFKYMCINTRAHILSLQMLYKIYFYIRKGLRLSAHPESLSSLSSSESLSARVLIINDIIVSVLPKPMSSAVK